MSSIDVFLGKIHNYSLHKKLPQGAQLLTLAKKTCGTLAAEDVLYRQHTSAKTAEGLPIRGGLLDFRKQNQMPCIVVPDIHARADFIFNILNFVLPKEISGLEKDLRIADALENDEVRVVCVGDILHAEGRERERWALAYEEFIMGVYCGKAMKAEMREGLGALMAVMECKNRWPKNFHCLKGNHENIKNETGGGNYAFRKFAYEGEMVFYFMVEQYGPDILDAVYDFEKLLPLAFCTKNLFVSHAEPLAALSQEAVIEAPLFEEAVLALTWTANNEAEEGGVKKMLGEFCTAKRGVYIGGHRPIHGKYNLRQGGLYVQIHNPFEQNIAVVRTDITFNPETQIVSVEK